MRRARYAVAALALAVALTAGTAQAAIVITHTGQMTADGGGLVGTGNWDSVGTILDWTVEADDSQGAGNPYLWTYTYRFRVPDAPATPGLSNIIFELSEGADADEFEFDWGDTEVKSWTSAGNAPLPDETYGVKFDNIGDQADVTLSIITERQPVWGDFFAKGGQSEAYNLGFLSPDTDPAGPLNPHLVQYNGAFQDHLLVPNHDVIIPPPPPPPPPPIPEPASAAAIGMGLAGLSGYIRRRRTA